MFAYAAIWLVLALALGTLLVMRAIAGRLEDDSLHVRDAGTELVNKQRSMAVKLTAYDHWGRILGLVTMVYGLALASVYVYQAWNQSTTVF